MKKKLHNVTLLAVDTLYPGKAAASLFRSLKEIEVDRVVLFTNVEMTIKGIEVVQIPEIKSKDDYSRFALKELAKYITTKFAIVSQHDSWVLNGHLFPDELYNFDYAGALWIESDGLRNGNGGMSFRSKKLMDAVANDSTMEVLCPEDVSLCRIYRRYLEHTYGLKWAPDNVCEMFSFECIEPVHKTFAFHNFFHRPYRECVVVSRQASLGDVVQIEPVLHYFHKKGYRVFLDTLPQFWFLFAKHYFPIEHVSNINERMPYKHIQLNMAYELNPKQLHLQSYYEAAGIADGEIRNPKLSFNITPENKLFKKYVTLHIDKRAQNYRNIYGINWAHAVAVLKEKGYDTIQLGAGESEDIEGAIKMKSSTINFLEYIIAGAEGHIGCDSGPSNIALAFDIPLIVFHGSVPPETIYPNMDKVRVITNHSKEKPICATPYCWADVHGGVEGQPCIVDVNTPPCTQYKTQDLLNAIHEML